MPTKGKKSIKTKVNALSRAKKNLGKEDIKKVKGGLLLYIEQDNITGLHNYRSKNDHVIPGSTGRNQGPGYC